MENNDISKKLESKIQEIEKFAVDTQFKKGVLAGLKHALLIASTVELMRTFNTDSTC